MYVYVEEGKWELKEACQCLKDSTMSMRAAQPCLRAWRWGRLVGNPTPGLLLVRDIGRAGQVPLPPRHLTPDTQTPCLSSHDQAFQP